MNRALILVLVLALPFVAVAQFVVKVNVPEIAGTIPPAPSDVKEAYARSACHEDTILTIYGGSVNCTAEAFFKPVADRLEATNKQIGKAIEVLSKPQTDAAKQMDQKEMQKKFKTMSREEQIKMAMEMGKKMGMTSGAVVPESKPVMAAREECMKVNEAIGSEMIKANEYYQRKAKLEEDRERKHKEIDAWKETEEPKLPQINTGEMSVAEPKALHALLVKTNDKHIAVENDYLKAVRKEWNTMWDKYKSLYGPLQDKLAAINYGEDAKNHEYNRQFLGAQANMVSGTGELIKISREATDKASGWWARKLKLDREKGKQ